MGLDVGTVKGLLELEDRFTDRLEKAGAAEEAFEAKTTKGFAAVGQSASEAEQWFANLANSSAAFHAKADALQSTLGQLAANNQGLRTSLNSLAEAAGLTATSLGAAGSSAAVLATATAGWQFGRAIAGWFDLDKAISNATAALFGWGDAAAQAAGAKADVLAKASKTAGREITDLGIAMAINAGHQKEWQESIDTSARRVANWHTELAKVKAAGTFDQLTKDVKSHEFSLQELATRYKISADAVNFLAKETAAASKAEKDAAEATARHNQARLTALGHEMAALKAARELQEKTLLELTKLEEQYNVERVRQSGTANDLQIAQIEKWAAVTEEQLRKAGIVSKQVYAQLHADAKQALDAVGIDWSDLRDHSIKTLQEQALNAQRTYEQATLYSGGMSQAGIEHFRALRDAALANLRQMDTPFGATFQHMRDEVDHASFTFRAWLANAATDAEKAALGFDKMGRAIRTIADEAKRADAELRRMAGFSFDVTSENFSQTLFGLGLSPGANAEALAHEGYSLQEIVAILRGAPKGPPRGPRIPGFQFGGAADFGSGALAMLHGPEAIVPLGGSTGGGLAELIALLRSILADKTQPGGFNSVEALTAALNALTSKGVGGLSEAHDTIEAFVAEAVHSIDFITQGAVTGNEVFQHLMDRIHAITDALYGGGKGTVVPGPGLGGSPQNMNLTISVDAKGAYFRDRDALRQLASDVKDELMRDARTRRQFGAA